MMPALQMSSANGRPRALKLDAKDLTLLRQARSRGWTSTGWLWHPSIGEVALSACNKLVNNVVSHMLSPAAKQLEQSCHTSQDDICVLVGLFGTPPWQLCLHVLCLCML